jgi:cysteine desulfuration protein SufE
MSLKEAEAELIADLSMLEDWNDRYEYIIGLGRSLPPYPEELRTEDREVHGCQSQVWLDARLEDGRLHFLADSNALITKGLVALLVNLYSGRTADEIAAASLDFLRGVGLASHLTPSRVNGLHAMFKRIQRHAADHAVTPSQM